MLLLTIQKKTKNNRFSVTRVERIIVWWIFHISYQKKKTGNNNRKCPRSHWSPLSERFISCFKMRMLYFQWRGDTSNRFYSIVHGKSDEWYSLSSWRSGSIDSWFLSIAYEVPFFAALSFGRLKLVNCNDSMRTPLFVTPLVRGINEIMCDTMVFITVWRHRISLNLNFFTFPNIT